MNRYVSLVMFPVLVLGGALALGGLTVPGGWHAGLIKPSFSPRRCCLGRRVCQRWTQFAMNFLWTSAFFAAYQISLALVVYPRIHFRGVAARPLGGKTVRALCRLGRLRISA